MAYKLIMLNMCFGTFYEFIDHIHQYIARCFIIDFPCEFSVNSCVDNRGLFMRCLPPYCAVCLVRKLPDLENSAAVKMVMLSSHLWKLKMVSYIHLKKVSSFFLSLLPLFFMRRYRFNIGSCTFQHYLMFQCSIHWVPYLKIFLQ